MAMTAGYSRHIHLSPPSDSDRSFLSRERRVEFNDGMDELPRDLVANSTKKTKTLGIRTENTL